MKPVSTMPAPLSTTNRTTESLDELQEQIRRRANELYEQRGRVPGFALDDWLHAETEILGAQKQQKVRAAKRSK
jgi:hypothetical protein